MDGRQEIVGPLEFFGDALFSKREFARGLSISSTCPTRNFTENISGNTGALDLTPGFRYELPGTWSLELTGLYGKENSTPILAEGFASGFDQMTNFDDNELHGEIGRSHRERPHRINAGRPNWYGNGSFVPI